MTRYAPLLAASAMLLAALATRPSPADGTAAPTPSPVPASAFTPVLVRYEPPIKPTAPPTLAARPTVEEVLGVTGIASWMPEKYGRDYLALPAGPGWRARICGAGGCWEAVSNDAGPDRAMQRKGRVADLAVIRWEAVCGVPRSMGLCPVSVQIIGRVK